MPVEVLSDCPWALNTNNGVVRHKTHFITFAIEKITTIKIFLLIIFLIPELGYTDIPLCLLVSELEKHLVVSSLGRSFVQACPGSHQCGVVVTSAHETSAQR